MWCLPPLKITPQEIYTKNMNFPNVFTQEVMSVYRTPRCWPNGINLLDIWDFRQAESFYWTSGMSEMWNQFIGIRGCLTIFLSDIPDVKLLRCSFVLHLWSSKFSDKCTFEWDVEHLTWTCYWLLLNFQSDCCNFFHLENYLMVKEKPFYHYQNFYLYVIVKDYHHKILSFCQLPFLLHLLKINSKVHINTNTILISFQHVE